MGRFDTTSWSLVLRARGDPAVAHAALETLCRTYRPPVLAYVRSRVRSLDVAEDLTQAFFERFLRQTWHANADPQRGKFRCFLLCALKRFLIDANAEATALKRGGSFHFEPLDEDVSGADGDADSPERAFEREWAKAVLASAVQRLRDEAAQAGKLELFEHLSEFLVERPDEADYVRVADELHLRRNTLAVAVHRLRRRLRDVVRHELAETTADSGGLQDELRVLRGSLDEGAP